MGGHLAGDGADKGPVIPRTSAGVEAQLTGEPMSIGYEPQLPVRSFWIDGGMPPYWEFVRDIEAMRRHPHVRDCLNIYMGGIWPAKFKIKASSPEIAEFVGDQIRRYWSRSLRAVQDSAYSYGHCGGEVTFANERGRMVYKDMTVFHPADAKVLVKRNRFVGIRVRSSKPLGDGAPDDSMSADLWSGTPSRPGKAFWYCHNSRNSRWYGESQLLAAWRPWRRLSYPDGLDEVLDGGLYRYAYGGYVVKAPPGSEKALRQPAGAARQDYLDKAREMAESLKAGASIGMSSEAWEGNGQPKWSIEQLHAEINVSGLLEGKKNLTDEISFGIGVPPEIREASDTGSGYSGRAVPKEVFYLGQQHHAESQVKACRLHWLDGLIHWNYGKDAWFEIEVAPLLASQQQQVDGQGGAAKEEGAGEPQQGGESDDGGLGAIFGGEPDAGAQQLKTPEPIGTVVIAAPLTPAETTSYEEMILAEIVKAATRTAATLSRQARREIQAAIHGRPAILWADAVSVVLRRYGPKFGRILRDVRVAAAFVGARRGGNFITPPGSNSMSPPPDRPWGLPPMSDDHGPGVTLPVIEEAARDLEERRIFTRPHFDQLESAESARSFTVANLHDDSAVASARDLIVAAVTDGTTQRDFAKQLDTALDGGASHLSPAHVETVFRTNVMNAYSNGLEAVLDQPGVGDGFPYAQYDSTHDDRSRPEHRAMEKSGIAGTNVYRRDDPVWMKFRPPWGYSCRCAWTPLTLKQAADLGIAEAQEWLRTGIEPAVPSWVPHPDFDLPPGWHRLALGEPEGAEEFQWLTGNAQLSFTGVKEDSIGRKMYYREGVHIAGPSDSEKAEIEAAQSDDSDDSNPNGLDDIDFNDIAARLPKDARTGDTMESIKRFAANVAVKTTNVINTIMTKATLLAPDIIDTAEDWLSIKMAKDYDPISQHLGIGANTAMVVVSHIFSRALNKLGIQLALKTAEPDFAAAAEHAAALIAAVYDGLGLPAPTTDNAELSAAIRKRVEEKAKATGNAQLSFTGVKEDSIGRKMYYREGVHIAGPSDGEKAEIEAARSDDPPGDIKAKSGKKTTKTSKAKRPPKAAPGSQMDDATKAKLMEFGMKGSFPPADVPLSEIEFADLSRGADSLKFEALMWWTQKGTDSGRLSSQYRYTKAFHDRNAAEKHERVKAIEPYIGKIAGTLNAQMGDVSLPQRQREAAAIASVIRETGLRPTDSNESIKHGHFGISSLQARHLKLVGNKVHLDFIGKEGVHNKSIVRDPANVAFLKAAMGGKSGKAFIFEKATGNDAGVVLKAAAVGAGGSDDIKIKDLRTLKAHQLGRQAVANFKGPPPPLSGNKKNDAKAIAKAILAMSTEVSQVLNNQPTEARNTYIHPEIFKSWQANLANAR